MSRRARRGAARPRPPAAAQNEARTLPPPANPGALAALTVTLVALAIARGALPLLPGMGAWSLNLHRFVAPWIGWPLWMAATLALIPALGARLLPAWEWMGGAIERRPGWSMLVAALCG